MKSRKKIDSSVDKELYALSKRLVKVGQYERICRDFDLRLTTVKNFGKNSPGGTTLRTFRVIEAAVATLENENDSKDKRILKK